MLVTVTAVPEVHMVLRDLARRQYKKNAGVTFSRTRHQYMDS